MNNINDIEFDIDRNTPLYSIGVISDLLNVSVHTIRLYESEGLIIPFKKDSKHRLYSQNDLIRLKCIIESIREKKFSIAAIKMMYSLIPCWSIIKCSENEREECSAYNSNLMPCWTYKHQNNTCENITCNQCEVYLKHSNCDSIKESIKESTKLN
jgi:MerR family transcriptional regulator, heat shock protein HspR